MHAPSIGTALALIWASALPLASAQAGSAAAPAPGDGPADTVVQLPIERASHTSRAPHTPAPGYQPVLLQPNLNITPEQLAIAARRSHLPFAAKLECSALDTRLPTLERNFRRAKADRKAEAEQDLQQARLRFVLLRC